MSEFSDVKHMGYFEFTLGRKESNRLFNVLSELKIPTSILRGVRKDMPYDEVVDGYRIIQIMSEETAPGQSPEVVYFAIKDEKQVKSYLKVTERPWKIKFQILQINLKI